MRVISQPPGPEALDRYRNYVYRSDLQKQIFIYHAELGINQIHIDFAGRPVEWLYTERARFTGNNIEKESPCTDFPGHSTCTASKAVGNIYASSRLATLVVVKMPDLRSLSTCEVFSTISDHIRENDRQGRSIVTVSWGSKYPIKPRDIGRGGYWSHWRRVRKPLGELSDSGNLVIFAAGNEARQPDFFGQYRREVDTAPAIFTYDSNILNLLAVSNVDNGGSLWPTSQRNLANILKRRNLYAPGVDVKCAAHDGNLGFQTETGTSFCASHCPCSGQSPSFC